MAGERLLVEYGLYLCAQTVEALNAAFTAAAAGELKGILGVDSNLLVSSDYKGNPLSSICLLYTS